MPQTAGPMTAQECDANRPKTLAWLYPMICTCRAQLACRRKVEQGDGERAGARLPRHKHVLRAQVHVRHISIMECSNGLSTRQPQYISSPKAGKTS